MAGMPGAAVAARNGVMAVSLAVIVVMGGWALLDDPGQVTVSAPPPSPGTVPGGPTPTRQSVQPVQPEQQPGQGPASAPASPEAAPPVSAPSPAPSGPPPVPGADTGVVDALGTGVPGADGAAVRTALTLERVTVPHARRGHITLQGRLTAAETSEPLDGTVTLWRRTSSGRWKPIIADRATSVQGIVQLEVQQAGGRAVYRLTSAADGVHAAATSSSLSVRR